jgi:hypothetical protein
MANKMREALPHHTTSAPTFKKTILLSKLGAGEGIRTLDPNLGKVVLYP